MLARDRFAETITNNNSGFPLIILLINTNGWMHMLTDSEIIDLRKDKSYIKKTKMGLSHFAKDLIISGNGDLSPDVQGLARIIHSIFKARTIRSELYNCGSKLLELLINRDLNWVRDPDSIKSLCEAESENYIWLRYDEPRVAALFSYSIMLFKDAEYRTLIKRYSSIQQNKNERLKHLLTDLNILRERTLLSIQTRGIFDDLINLKAQEFYRKNKDEIQANFVEASKSGALGLLPGGNRDDSENG